MNSVTIKKMGVANVGAILLAVAALSGCSGNHSSGQPEMSKSDGGQSNTSQPSNPPSTPQSSGSSNSPSMPSGGQSGTD